METLYHVFWSKLNCDQVLEVTMRDGNSSPSPFLASLTSSFIVLEVTMRDGNPGLLTRTARKPASPRFRSDYEGWKPKPECLHIPKTLCVLEVTMRDGNMRQNGTPRGTTLKVLEVTMRDGNPVSNERALPPFLF